MILPPGPLDHDETIGGLRSGAVFFRRFRERFSTTPAILFTNVSSGQIRERYHAPGQKSWVSGKVISCPTRP